MEQFQIPIQLGIKWHQKQRSNISNKSGKLYVPVVTLSINGNITFLENIKQGFKRTISWNKYRSEITTD